MCLRNFERVKTSQEVGDAQLKEKVKLQNVVSSWDSKCTIGSVETATKKIELVYERIQPPTGIETIQIDSYPDTKFLTWINCTICSSLKEIYFLHCKFLESLPNLGLLPNPVDLRLIHVGRVKDFDIILDHAGGNITFPKLKTLLLHSMESLEEWRFEIVLCLTLDG